MALLLAFAAPNEFRAALPHTAVCPQGYAVQTSIATRSVFACHTGVGPVNAAISLAHVLATTAGITGVINIGLAGSYDLQCAPLQSAWCIAHETWPEYGLADETTVGCDARKLGFPLWEDTQDAIWQDMPVYQPDTATYATWLADEKIHCLLPTATALTVAGASGTHTYAQKLYQRYGAVLENMEGFAVALTCHRFAVPLLEIRIVSNLAGTQEPEYRAFADALACMPRILQSLLLP